MKSLILALLLATGPVFAAEGETYTEKVEGQMSKVEALYKLIQAKGAGKPEPRIYKCVLVEVSSKGTIKNK